MSINYKNGINTLQKLNRICHFLTLNNPIANHNMPGNVKILAKWVILWVVDLMTIPELIHKVKFLYNILIYFLGCTCFQKVWLIYIKLLIIVKLKNTIKVKVKNIRKYYFKKLLTSKIGYSKIVS